MNDPQQGWNQQAQGPGPAAPGYPPGAPVPGYAPGLPTEQERMWGMLAHLSPLVLGFIGPLVLMLADVTGQPSAFVKHHAKQSLIWTVALIVVAILTCGVGALVMMVFQILAGIAANRGEWYVYPGCGSFVDRV